MPAPAFDHIRRWNTERAEKGWWHSFQLPDGSTIQGVCSLEGLKNRLAQFPIPDDLRGKRALDIGCWDGWFSFELERRGAEVMAVDCWDNSRFRKMHSVYRSKIDYRQMDMFELTPARIGRFDLVLFMGVLYHLKHPLLALERVCALTTDLAAVDSFILREGQGPTDDLCRPILEFYEADEMGGQPDNWFGPSLPALLGMCRTAGFARVELRSVLEFSACVACYRRWEQPAGSTEPPQQLSALHMTNFGLNFRSDMDDYVASWFVSPLALSVDNVKPEVSGFGVRPISVTELGEHSWQANFKLPPLPKPGWHEVRIRVSDSLPSNPQSIALDMPFVVGRVKLCDVYDAATWKPRELDTSKGSALSFWIEGLPENADLNNVRATLGDQRLRLLYLEPPAHRPQRRRFGRFRGSGARQVNAQIAGEPPCGRVPLVVEVGARCAGQVLVDVRR
ncbi:MAG TPA: methyltransferase domain-containing protein [Bryobacteraceae bacterium]|nr:methyltransferase domain-containing protein [Bryobacteraceae bacterium]